MTGKKLFGIIIGFLITFAYGIIIQAETIPPTTDMVYFVGEKYTARFPFLGYITEPSQLKVHQAANFQVTNEEEGIPALAVDQERKRVYMCYRESNEVFVYDMRTLESLPTITIVGGENLSAIAVDAGRGKIYVADSEMERIYVLDKETYARKYSEEFDIDVVPNSIAVAGNKLFVADQTTDVKYYSLDTKNLVDSFTTNYPAYEVAVDDSSISETLLFAVVYDFVIAEESVDFYLAQCNISTGTELDLLLGRMYDCNLSINTDRKAIYITCEGEVEVVGSTIRLYSYDGTSFPVEQDRQALPEGCDFPGACAVFQAPFGIGINIECPSHPAGEAVVGETVKYDVKIKNSCFSPVTFLPSQHRYDATYFLYQNAQPEPDEDGVSLDKKGAGKLEELTWLIWDDLTEYFESVPIGQTVTVSVNLNALEETEQTDYLAFVENARDSFGNVLTADYDEFALEILGDASATVEKVCTSHPSNIASVGETVIFQITITNTSAVEIEILPLRDIFDSECLRFLNAAPNPNEAEEGELNWIDLGTVPVEGSVTVNVEFLAIDKTVNTDNTARVHDAKDIYGHDVPASQNICSVTISGQEETEIQIQGGTTQLSYVMVSFPVTPANPDPVFNLINSLGDYDKTMWRLFRWDPIADPPGYVEYPLGGDLLDIKPGAGYWIISRNSATLSVTGELTSLNKDYVVYLQPGWNQIGHPFTFEVSLDDISVSDGTETHLIDSPENTFTRHTVWKFADGIYAEAGILRQGMGYWIKNLTDEVISLIISPDPVPAGALRMLMRNTGDEDLPPAPPSGDISGESSPAGSSSGCFIATACYGSPMAQEVEILKAFRDRHLLTNAPGRMLTRLYYRYSPPAAKFLRMHRVPRKIVRGMLYPVVQVCKKIK